MVGKNIAAILKKQIPFHLILLIVPFLALVCSLAGYCGALHWTLDLFSHFKTQYFLVAAVGAAAIPAYYAYARRRSRGDNGSKPVFGRKTAVAAFATAVFAMALNIFEIVPLYLSPPRCSTSVDAAPAKPTKLLFINVNTANKRYGDVEKLVLDKRPDILVLAEVDDAWIAGIPRILEAYPFRIMSPRGDNFGIALFAKRQPRESKLLPIGNPNYGIQCVRWRFEMNGRRTTLFGAHVLPPVRRSGYNERNAMLADLAEMADKENGGGTEVVLVGDLNITPWSVFFKRLKRDSGLRDARRGFGIQPSWPTITPLFPLLIPIDHCLVSKGLSVVELKTGPDVGSDHYPVEIKLSVGN